MIGRIFMNQESKVINVHLEKRENKEAESGKVEERRKQKGRK